MPRIKWPALSKAPSPGPRLARAEIPRLVTAPAPRPRLRGSLHSGEREGSLTHAFHHAMLKFGLQMQQDIYRMLYKCITSISWLFVTFWDSKLTDWLTDWKLIVFEFYLWVSVTQSDSHRLKLPTTLLTSQFELNHQFLDSWNLSNDMNTSALLLMCWCFQRNVVLLDQSILFLTMLLRQQPFSRFLNLRLKLVLGSQSTLEKLCNI